MSLNGQSNRCEVYAHHPVTTRGALLRRSRKTIEPSGDRNVTESRGREHVDELCFQQSAADSIGP